MSIYYFSSKQITSGLRSLVYNTVVQVAAKIFAITRNQISHFSRVEPSEKKMKSLEAWSNIWRNSLIVCLRAVHCSAVDGNSNWRPNSLRFFIESHHDDLCFSCQKSVAFNYSSPAQDHSHSKNQSKAYQVQMKHYALIFYVLRFSLFEQYFNVWHTALKYLEPFFFFNFLILRCLNGLNSPPFW